MLNLTVTAGTHTRRHEMLTVTLTDAEKMLAGIDRTQPVVLCYAGGKILPAQLTVGEDNTAELAFLLDILPAGESVVLTLKNSAAHAPYMAAEDLADAGKVTLKQNTEGGFETAYQYNIGFAKPHIGPIFNKYGEYITRYDFTAEEHPHHRSIWFSHGSVCLDGKSDAVDTWNENPHYGYIKNQKIEKVISGDVYCGFAATNVWTDENGQALCDDHTEVKVSCPEDGVTCLDVHLTLTATYGEVSLGATKEAGPIAVRMADNLRADATGVITASQGTVGEQEIWMKKSFWNDYSGKTEGGHTCGVAVFDNPENAGYPTYWHSRNYGLFAPNRFYRGGDEKIPAGESVSFIYRIVIHEGDAAEARIAEKYVDYVAPAAVAIVEE